MRLTITVIGIPKGQPRHVRQTDDAVRVATIAGIAREVNLVGGPSDRELLDLFTADEWRMWLDIEGPTPRVRPKELIEAMERKGEP
jgi:hypothetical protein